MKTFPVDLMSLIDHIQRQYEKVLNNKSFKNRMCFCKQSIFSHFTYTVEKVIIKLGARTLKYMEDYDLEKGADFSSLKEWFNDEIYEGLYANDQVSNKMVLTFQLLQKYQDDKFFDLIEKKYTKILVLIGEDKETGIENELNLLYEEIRAWYELFLYMILSTQFSCQSFDDFYLRDYQIESDVEVGEGKRCIHDGNCDVHEKVVDAGEQVNIIMTNDFIDDTTWLDNLMTIVSKYHVDSSSVKLTLDYRMYNHLVQCKLSSRHYDKLLETNEYFTNMYIKNHEGINFNGYYDKIKHLLM